MADTYQSWHAPNNGTVTLSELSEYRDQYDPLEWNGTVTTHSYKHQRSCAWTLHLRHSDSSQSEKDIVI